MKTEAADLRSYLEACPIRDVLDRLGDRWTMLVILELTQGTKRFSELRRSIPDVSPRMLSQTVRRLEQDGLVSRTQYPTVPPRVDYTITELGTSLVRSMLPLVDWAKDHHDAIKRARAAYVPPRTDAQA